MTDGEKLKVLAEVVLAIVEGLHDSAREHCECPLACTAACVSDQNYARIQEIAKG